VVVFWFFCLFWLFFFFFGLFFFCVFGFLFVVFFFFFFFFFPLFYFSFLSTVEPRPFFSPTPPILFALSELPLITSPPDRSPSLRSSLLSSTHLWAEVLVPQRIEGKCMLPRKIVLYLLNLMIVLSLVLDHPPVSPYFFQDATCPSCSPVPPSCPKPEVVLNISNAYFSPVPLSNLFSLLS